MLNLFTRLECNINPNMMTNSALDENHNKRYRLKYKYMKLRVKSFILKNAAMCDEVAKIQENIQIVKDERKFLLRKLLEYENELETSQVYYRNDILPLSNGSKSKTKKRRSLEDTGKINTLC